MGDRLKINELHYHFMGGRYKNKLASLWVAGIKNK